MGNGTKEMSNCEFAKHARKSKRLVKAFADACEELAFMGAAPVARHAEIKAEYKRTRANLLAHMGV